MTVQSCRRSHASPRPVKFIELAQSRGWMNCRHGVSGSHSSMKPWDLKKKSPTRLPLAAQVNPLFSSKRKSPGSCRMTTTTAPLDRKQMAFVVELSGFLYVRRGNHRLSLCVFVLQQSSSYQSHITDEIRSALPAVPAVSHSSSETPVKASRRSWVSGRLMSLRRQINSFWLAASVIHSEARSQSERLGRGRWERGSDSITSSLLVDQQIQAGQRGPGSCFGLF